MNWIKKLRLPTDRFTAFTGAAIIVALGLVIGLTSEAAYRTQQRNEGAIQSQTLAEGVTAALMFDDSATAQEIANALGVNPRIVAVGIYRSDGKKIAAYTRATSSPPPTLSVNRANSIHQNGFVEATAPGQRDGQVYGSVFVRLAHDPIIVRLGRYVPIGLLVLMAVLVLLVAGAAQTALSLANYELEARAKDLTDANALLREQIEQRKQVEEALLQSRKLEAIGQLTGGVAHDFNNLLMIVAGGLRLIDKQEKGSDRWIRTINGMHQAVERGAGLTRQLLAFSRRQPMQIQTVNVEQQLLGMQELLDRSLRADILLEIKIPKNLPLVKTDPGLFELAILNLSVNARDAMPKGGMLTILARTENTGSMVEVIVKDTGTGISPEVLERIFEPYFTTKALGMGTGLGMSQVYGFAQQSGGSIRIETELNVGTSVILSLPASADSLGEPDRPASKVQKTWAKRRKILVVEDDDQVAETVCNMLLEIGHEFTRVSAAREALTVLDTGAAFDLVFSDIIMPGGKNGIELSHELKTTHPKLPVLLTTGFSGNQEIDPDQPLLRKPYQLDDLRDAIAALPDRT